jgi:hypothetical protein
MNPAQEREAAAVSHLEAVRHDPGYGDQVPRKLAWLATHDGDIIYLGAYWKGVLYEGHGATTEINRITLKELLDKLESLDG